jgi:hypothetical protein
MSIHNSIFVGGYIERPGDAGAPECGIRASRRVSQRERRALPPQEDRLDPVVHAALDLQPQSRMAMVK